MRKLYLIHLLAFFGGIDRHEGKGNPLPVAYFEFLKSFGKVANQIIVRKLRIQVVIGWHGHPSLGLKTNEIKNEFSHQVQLHVQIAWFYSYIHKLFRKKKMNGFFWWYTIIWCSQAYTTGRWYWVIKWEMKSSVNKCKDTCLWWRGREVKSKKQTTKSPVPVSNIIQLGKETCEMAFKSP